MLDWVRKSDITQCFKGTPYMFGSYLNNAIRMWENGTASMDDIDTAMMGGCNFPMGPFAMSDLAGLDIGWKATPTCASQ